VGCLLGVDGLASRAAELDLLREAGVDLRLVRLDRGPIFENLYIDGHRRQHWRSKSDQIPVSAFPNAWLGASGWLLVPVAGEVGEGWAKVPASGARIAVGAQGMMREFADNGSVRRVEPVPSALLRAAGLVCASVGDLIPETDLALLRQLAPGASIVLTAGDGGGIAIRDGELERYRAIPADRVTDPTGAGDVFLAALTAGWLLLGERATPRVLRFAAAAGSCAVEGVGLGGVPKAGQVATRLLSATRSR
jgi:sugar/nucleoside kinase (ribokinase family)